jgi:programmed cell death protein 5
VSYDEEDIEEIRRRRALELRRQLTEAQSRANAQQEAELQKRELLRKILSPEARQRLNRLKMVKPDFATQLELQLIQTAQTGRINIPITDEQLKTILTRLQGGKREIKIRRM